MLLSTKIQNDVLELKFSSRFISSIEKRIAIIWMWGGSCPQRTVAGRGRSNPWEGQSQHHSLQSNSLIPVLQAMSCVYYGRSYFKNLWIQGLLYLLCQTGQLSCHLQSYKLSSEEMLSPPSVTSSITCRVPCSWQEQSARKCTLNGICLGRLGPILDAGALKMTTYDSRSLKLISWEHRLLKCTESLT